MDVVGDDRRRLGLGDRSDLETAVLPEPHAPRPLVEDDRLPVHEADLVVHALRLVPEQIERAVVEDVAVLIDLDERRAVVLGRLPQDLGQMLAVVVDRARDERRGRAKREGDGVEGPIDRAERGRLRDLPNLEVGEYWPFVRP